MTRKEFIDWFEVAYGGLTKLEIYALGQIYDSVSGKDWNDIDDDLPPLKETFIAGFSDGESLLVFFENEEERDEYIKNVKAFTHWRGLPEPPKKHKV